MMEMQALADKIEHHAALGKCDDALNEMLERFMFDLEVSYQELKDRLDSL